MVEEMEVMALMVTFAPVIRGGATVAWQYLWLRFGQSKVSLRGAWVA